MGRKLITVGLIFILLSIVLGAFAAHALETAGVKDAQMNSFQTGVRYMQFMGLGFLLLALLEDKFDFILKVQVRQIFYGTLLFSGSIFSVILFPLMDIELPRFFHFITPLGGALIILGWLGITIKYIRANY